jgi:hypothetical protein
MALQSAVNPLLGLRFLSESSFLAGMVGMLIHLDRDGYSGGRTPLLHSVLFCTLYSWCSSVLLVLFFSLGLMPMDVLNALVMIIPTGFTAHLLADSCTREGIFLFPDRLNVLGWFRRRPDSENSWMNWKRYSLDPKRGNDDPILNLSVSSISLVVLIAFLAVTPL